MRQHLCELGQPLHLQRGVIRRLVAIRPARRAGDRDHHAQVVTAGGAHERVEVREVIRAVVAIQWGLGRIGAIAAQLASVWIIEA